MAPSDDVASFVAKWQARWPEWAIARAFLPASGRAVAEAWFALLQELTDAAWGGADATPGLAKLAWWQEELQGWARGARRHPLATVLQRHDAPWPVLATSLPSLARSRERPPSAEAAVAALRPFAAAAAQCEAMLLGAPADDPDALARALLAGRRLADPDALPAAPQPHGVAPVATWASGLPSGGAVPRRVLLALLRARLAAVEAGTPPAALSPWRTLLLAWRAARAG